MILFAIKTAVSKAFDTAVFYGLISVSFSKKAQQELADQLRGKDRE
jgi:hypothetical protein